MTNELSFRLYQPDDLHAVWVIFRDARIAIGDERPISLDDMRAFFQMPGFDPAQDAFVVERGGEIVAYADIQLMQERGFSWSRGTVHPDHLHQGIGAAIIRFTEAHFLKRTADLPPDQPLALQRNTFDSNAAALRLFERTGYRIIRTFYDMSISLEQPFEAPPLPGGLVLRPFDPEQQGHALYKACEEVFADHWGFELQSYEDWVAEEFGAVQGDFSFWLLAYDGDEIAGFSLNHALGEGDMVKGSVDMFGVLPRWRKQGLGLALLKASFALFQQRRVQTVLLGVDSGNTSHAARLYESAGMHIDKRTLYYRKMLRGTAEGE